MPQRKPPPRPPAVRMPELTVFFDELPGVEVVMDPDYLSLRLTLDDDGYQVQALEVALFLDQPTHAERLADRISMALDAARRRSRWHLGPPVVRPRPARRRPRRAQP